MNHFKLDRIEGSPREVCRALVAGAAMLFALTLSSAAGAATIASDSVADPAVSSQAKADVVVLSVLEPVPPGAQPGGGMFLQATVKARGVRARRTIVRFYLSKDGVLSADDVQIASETVGRFDHPDTVGVAGHLPAEVPPGFYFVLACAGSGKCAASEATIQVIGQGLSVVNQSLGLTFESPDQPEYFPERPADGMSVGSPFPCPFSFHGQWPGSCVFVTTRVFKGNGDVVGFMYCPIDHPYPYEVAIGFDLLWNDLSDQAPAMTNGVSFTKYRQGGGEIDLSYGGGSTQATRRSVAMRRLIGTKMEA